MGCRKIFTSSGATLQHSAVQEKVICDKFADFTFICDGRLEQVRMRGIHGWEEVSLRRGIKASEETEITRKKMRNGGGMRNG
jgi:hypothetical protein